MQPSMHNFLNKIIIWSSSSLQVQLWKDNSSSSFIIPSSIQSLKWLVERQIRHHITQMLPRIDIWVVWRLMLSRCRCAVDFILFKNINHDLNKPMKGYDHWTLSFEIRSDCQVSVIRHARSNCWITRLKYFKDSMLWSDASAVLLLSLSIPI